MKKKGHFSAASCVCPYYGKNTEINLRRFAMDGQTVKTLLLLVCKIELGQSKRKALQAIASTQKL